MTSVMNANLSNVVQRLVTLKWLPVIINLLLIIWISLLFSDIVWSFFSTGIPASLQPKEIPGHQTDSLVKPDQISGQQIASWHLFGTTTKSVSKKPVSATVNAPDTNLKLTLRGIYATADNHAGYAIIQNQQKEERYFAYTDKVFGLATLEEIYTDRVILLRNGRYETLRLPEERITVNTQRHKTAATSRPVTAEEQVKFMKGEMKKIHQMTLKEMKNPWQYLYFEPEMVNGSMLGLKLTAEEESEFLARNGLELGDIITSVNGIQIDGGGGVARAMNELSDRDDEDRLELIIMRKGRSKTIVINNKTTPEEKH